jgi:hypothetical protein
MCDWQHFAQASLAGCRIPKGVQFSNVTLRCCSICYCTAKHMWSVLMGVAAANDCDCDRTPGHVPLPVWVL